LFYQYIPDPKTMYRQVKKLKPGYKLTYHLDNRRTDIDRYWRLKVNTTTGRKRKREDIAEELRYLIGKSVRNHLIADVPTGTFLSGGIDSSIITYEAAQAAPKIHAFSIGFTEKEFDESEIAERFCLEKNIMLKKKTLIDKLYEGSTKNFVAALCQNGELTEADIDELKMYFKMGENK